MDQHFSSPSKVVESVLTLVLVFLVIGVCLLIISPFILAILWAIIIAVSVFPPYNFLVSKMKGRRVFPAVVVTMVMLAFIFLPVLWFFSSAASNVGILTTYLHSGELSIMSPSPGIQEWPIIGKPLFNFLSSLHSNVEALLQKYYPQILQASKFFLGGVLSATMTYFQLVLSVIIAGFLLTAKGTNSAIDILFQRIAGNRGAEFKMLCVSTIRSVIKGVLGVAIIQATLAGIGFFFAGIPYAGVLTILCLVLSILQIGSVPVIIGVVIFLFYTHSTVFAILWTVYFIGVASSDNILKPILLGKGAHVPMLVIFLGVTGGFILYGFIGLFAGPIILSIGYKLILAWMYPVIEGEVSPAAVEIVE